MTIFKQPHGKSWRFDFRFKGHRYIGSTKTENEAEARKVEEALQRELRLEWGGLVPHRLLKGVKPVDLEDVDGAPRAMMMGALADIRIRSAQRIIAQAKAMVGPGEVGIVYFIGHDHEGPIKIGFTVNIEQRLRAIQTSSPLPIRMLASFSAPVAVERFLHTEFGEMRLEGEWFRRDGLILTAIELLRAGDQPAISAMPAMASSDVR